MSRARGPEARLLLTALGPERRKVTGVMLVLLVALLLRLAMPAMLGWFVDAAIEGRELSLLTSIAAAYVVVALTAEVLSLVVTWGSVSVSWRAGNRLRERLAHHALRLDMGWHARHSPGQLIERIDGDVEALAVFFSNVLVHVVGNVLLLVGMLVVSFTISPWAGLLLVATSVVGAVVLVKVRAAAVPAREAEREANAILYGDLEERLGGLEDLKANGAGVYAVHRLHANSARTWRAARRASLLGDGSYAFAAITFAVGSVATLALGFVLVQNELVTIGQVIALFRYSEMLRQPLEHIAEQMKEFQKALAGARRASTMLAEVPRIAAPEAGAAADLPEGALDVALDGVTFRYPGTDEPALHHTDLVIPAGTHVGVVGRTGSGKTTLGRLLLRLWDVSDGAVRLGGVDVRDLPPEQLRDRVAVVTQDVELFRASVRDNLTLFGSRPATDGELQSILRRVGLSAWLSHQRAGLDTHIEGGGLSAGEAQLLAVARAFLADPGLVILDEASSRLDPITEAALSHAVADLLEGRTAIVIAHRLATLDRVDDIVVVDDGRIVEHGTRHELARDPDSRYAALLATAATIPIEEALESFADEEGLGA